MTQQHKFAVQHPIKNVTLTKKQKNVMYNLEGNRAIQIYPEITEMMKFADFSY